MTLTFLGAAHEVTGSCFLVEARGRNIIIDCGMEQGRDIYENQDIPVAPADIDLVFLTHAHIDHSGRLPMLYKYGCEAPIYATTATSELCDIMLLDSAHIQESEAEYRNKKAKRSGGQPYEPLYTTEDAQIAIKAFKPCEYGEKIKVEEGISVRFTDVGHLLGSAAVELWIEEEGRQTKLVFSGDIGNISQPILRDPSFVTEGDYVIMESTYGDRSHGPIPDYVSQLTEILQSTFDRGGNVVIPSFAVGRTQEMLYFLREIKEKNLIKGHGSFKVYVDSPLAIEATHVFKENTYGFVDDDMLALLKAGINPLDFRDLVLSVTTDESKAINQDDSPKVIISASGMCEAGRIRHHLKHNLWRKESTILFVGFQSQGTIGRLLFDGAKSVKIFGESIKVAAEIKGLAAISGHADNEGLLRWAAAFEKKPRRIFVVHGEDGVCDLFAERLRNEKRLTATAPYNGEVWDLDDDVCLKPGNLTKIER
ncbi:MAG: MBL fold metallo-hydrolase, partial [Oscillospiraceae bacterium]|nr:MBL fold metallo-hydrolase [Oscillospiraceae bacterium]